MRLLLLPSVTLLALLSCACATHRSTSSRTTEITGEARDEGRRVYLRVAGGSADAVLLERPSQWSGIHAELEYGQELRIIGNSSGDFVHVRAVILGFAEEGWVWRPAVSVIDPAKHPTDQDRWQQEGLERGEYAMTPAGTRIDGFTPEPGQADPEAMRLSMERVLERVDSYEADRDRLMGDSTKLDQRYQKFAKLGGLSDD